MPLPVHIRPASARVYKLCPNPPVRRWGLKKRSLFKNFILLKASVVMQRLYDVSGSERDTAAASHSACVSMVLQAPDVTNT